MLIAMLMTLRVQTFLAECVFQDVMQPIPYSDLEILKSPIGQGGFGVVYRAQHPRFGTVVYKEVRVEKLNNRYSHMFKFNCMSKEYMPSLKKTLVHCKFTT